MADQSTEMKQASTPTPDTTVDPEITAIGVVYAGLKDLEADAQQRVLDFVVRKLKLRVGPSGPAHEEKHSAALRDEETRQNRSGHEQEELDDNGESDGISSVAKKWMRRNGLQPEKLSSVFSLGVDEIDLVAKSVPGKGKKERMRNVFLLKGVANYLGTGSPRFTYDEVKEALVHYDAYDSSNFAAFAKTLSADVSGSKESGYTLTARGLTNATTLLKEIAP